MPMQCTFCGQPCGSHICSAPSLPANSAHQKANQTGLERDDLGALVLAPGDQHFFFLCAHNALMMCSGICWGSASITPVFGTQFYNSIVVELLSFEVTQIKV